MLSYAGLRSLPQDWEFRIAGWGVINGILKRPGTLQDAMVDFLSDVICAGFIKQNFNTTKWQSQMCTTSRTGAGTCQGDSGGPLLLAKGNDPANHVQVGIVSFGLLQCIPEDGMFSVFTRVASFTSEDGSGYNIATQQAGAAPDIRSFTVDNFIGNATSRKQTNPTYATSLE